MNPIDVVPSNVVPLNVKADLRLSVDGVDASVVGDGSRVTVSTSVDPPALVLAARAQLSGRGAPGSRATCLRHGAEFAGRLLNDAGLSVRVVGPHGTLVEMGHGCSSAAGRVLLGSGYVRLGRPRVVLPLGIAFVRTSPITRAAALAVLAAAGATAYVRRKTS